MCTVNPIQQSSSSHSQMQSFYYEGKTHCKEHVIFHLSRIWHLDSFLLQNSVLIVQKIVKECIGLSLEITVKKEYIHRRSSRTGYISRQEKAHLGILLPDLFQALHFLKIWNDEAFLNLPCKVGHWIKWRFHTLLICNFSWKRNAGCKHSPIGIHI